MNGSTPAEAGANKIVGTIADHSLLALPDRVADAVCRVAGDDPDAAERLSRRAARMASNGTAEDEIVHTLGLLEGRLDSVADDGGIAQGKSEWYCDSEGRWRPVGAFLDDRHGPDVVEDPADPDVAQRRADPDQFFDKHGLLHLDLVDAVLARGPIAAGPGESVWWYDAKGVWRPGGANEIRRRCDDILGQRTRKSHREGVVESFRAKRPLIGGDPHLEVINCRSGLLNWRTGELQDHDPRVASTWQLAVKWNPDATCPTVDDWLAEVAPDDAINLVWQVIGAAIYAGLPVHKAIMLYGPGRNGKGTLLRLIKALVGDEHCAAVPLQALGENRFAPAELYGKAVNLAGDLDARTIVRTDVFKMVTGGDPIHAERKYGQPFVFTNQALMVFAANELPGTADHTDGFHSRWVIVPFTKIRLSTDEIDPTLEPRMHAELEGVFVKAVAGLRDLMDHGRFDEPDSVIDATAGYRDTSDPIRRFVDEHVAITGDPDDRATRRRIFDAYKAWCLDENHRPVAASKFWGRIRTIDDRIDVDGVTIQGNRYVTGVALHHDGITT